ncbi:unnamed protein product [Echinostoma caproni]|uniref:BZIP domain-containing protein n=1 Tax=Echinostoma caproni TaxID=27848 RepID=A0A183A795_9TREM|nr:unnamed protein product [Echinostoma caproni]
MVLGTTATSISPPSNSARLIPGASVNDTIGDGSNGGLSLASALAGILGLSFPSAALIPNGIPVPVAAANLISPFTPDLIDPNIFRASPFTQHSVNNSSSTTITNTNQSDTNNSPVSCIFSFGPSSIPTALSSALIGTTSSATLGNTTSYASSTVNNTTTTTSSTVPMQTCSDVSSETGSVQSPFASTQFSQTQPHSANAAGTNNLSDGGNKMSLATGPIGVETMDFDSCGSCLSTVGDRDRDRKQREFIPDSKKDDKYWERRRKNNEAAKRSREKRRQNDILMEHRINVLNAQNQKLRQELMELKLRYGLPLDDTEPVSPDTTNHSTQMSTPTNHGISNNGTSFLSTGHGGELYKSEDKMGQDAAPQTALSDAFSQPELASVDGCLVTDDGPDLLVMGNDPNSAPMTPHLVSVTNSDTTATDNPTISPHLTMTNNGTAGPGMKNGPSIAISPVPCSLSTSTPSIQQPIDSADLAALKRIFSTLAPTLVPDSTEPQTLIDPQLLSALGLDATATAWLFRQALLNPRTTTPAFPVVDTKLTPVIMNGTRSNRLTSADSPLAFASSPLDKVNALIKLPVTCPPVTPIRSTESVETPLDLSLCMAAAVANTTASLIVLYNKMTALYQCMKFMSLGVIECLLEYIVAEATASPCSLSFNSNIVLG